MGRVSEGVSDTSTLKILFGPYSQLPDAKSWKGTEEISMALCKDGTQTWELSNSIQLDGRKG